MSDTYLYRDRNVISDQSGVTVKKVHASGLQIWIAGISVNPLSNLNVTLSAHRFLASKVPSGFSKDL